LRCPFLENPVRVRGWWPVMVCLADLQSHTRSALLVLREMRVFSSINSSLLIDSRCPVRCLQVGGPICVSRRLWACGRLWHCEGGMALVHMAIAPLEVPAARYVSFSGTARVVKYAVLL
jgi:hypothetical protein